MIEAKPQIRPQVQKIQSSLHAIDFVHLKTRTKVVIVMAAILATLIAFILPLFALLASTTICRVENKLTPQKNLVGNADGSLMAQVADPALPNSIPTTPTAIIGTIAVMSIGFLLWLIKWLFQTYTELIKQLTPLTEAIKSLEIKIDSNTDALHRRFETGG